MADAFISYSRKDKDFVHRLDEALRSRKREAWVDWEGIRPTEEFMQAIYGAIESADTFIFVLTPDSVASVVCGREIAHAAEHNKRMVPIVRCDVEASAVPEALAKLNWIFCRDSDDFEKAADTIIQAFDTDLEWVRAHTRLLTRAIDWETKGKNSSFVLRGVDLRAAEQWLTEAGAEKERQPTPLQTNYIIASRKAAGRRQRITLGAVTFGAFVALVLAIVAWSQRNEAVAQRKLADERSRIALSRQLAAQSQAMVIQQPKLIERAGLLAIEAAQLHPSLETDQALRAVLALLPRARISLPCKKDVQELAFNPDGDSLLVVDGDHVMRYWNLPKQQEEWQMALGKDSDLLGISFSPDGSLCILKSSNGNSVYETGAGRLITKGERKAAFNKEVAVPSPRTYEVWKRAHPELDNLTTALSQNGRFAAVCIGQSVQVYDIAAQRLLGEVTPNQDIIDAQVDDLGRFVVVRGERGVQTQIWTLSPLKEFARFSDNTVQHVWFSPDGSCFATIGSLVASSVRIWRTSDGKEVTAIQRKNEPDSMPRGVALDPSGKFLVMPGTADEAWVCTVEGGRKLATLPHRGIERVALSRHNECIVTAGGEDGVRMWRLRRTSGKIAGVADTVALKDIGEVAAMCLTEDGTRLMTCSKDPDRAIRIWNTADGRLVTKISHRFGADIIACSADGALFVVGNETSRVDVYSAKDGKIVCSVDHPQHANSVALSPDGRYLATAAWRDFDYEARLWEVGSGKQVAAAIHDREVSQVLFSSDGRSLITAGVDNTSRLWSLNFTPEGKLSGATEVSRLSDSGAASVTADLRYLATADSGAVRIWWLKQEDLISQLQVRLFRNLTRLEWGLYFGMTPYRKTCPNLPDQPVE
jgi:WD40 repeat protein